ncbi:DegQ family serine endoprotease [Nitrospira sp. Kam-Ns4a]
MSLSRGLNGLYPGGRSPWPALLAFLLTWSGLVHCARDESPASQPVVAAPVPVSAGPASTPVPSNETFIAVAKVARESVVNIASVRKVSQRESPFPSPFFEDPFFRRFFGEEFERRFQIPRERREHGLGSGVIVSTDGYILTNNHVIEHADELEVLLGDKRKFKAKVVGTDPKTDVAVIKIDATGLPTLPWGDSSKLQVGELVLAVGNPFGLNQTVTMGIISAVGRANMGIVDYEDFIQTDAAINPGNSGGALVNLRGELVGINTAIFTRNGGFMGIGFAIPSNMARSVMESLIKHGKVVRGWLGVSIQEVSQDLAQQFGAPGTNGALVADVMEDSPAAKAGLERGDIITRFNGTAVKDPAHLRALVAETAPGTAVTLTVLRDKKSREITVTIAELPKELASASRGGKEGRGEHALAGVTVENYTPDRRERGRARDIAGVVVTEVQPDSPAERAGLRPGDVIREINRKPVRNVQDFERLTAQLTADKPVLLLLSRGNATIFLSINPQ